MIYQSLLDTLRSCAKTHDAPSPNTRRSSTIVDQEYNNDEVCALAALLSPCPLKVALHKKITMPMLQLMAAVLQLNASWVPAEPESFADLVVRPGRENVLTYDNGISLRVQVFDPAAYRNADDLVVGAQNNWR